MHTVARAALALAVVVLGAMPAPASAVTLTVDDLHQAAGRAAGRTALTPTASPAPCQDSTFHVSGESWASTLEWSYRSSSTPARLVKSGVVGVLKESFGNITGAQNSCGRTDNVSATSSYLGTTTRKPSCGSNDGYNVIGFRSLPTGILARTCWWIVDDEIVEADIQINENVPWALSLSSCRFSQTMLEAVMTHEVGHAFGMGHVSESKHGRLTMSTHLDAPCSNQESTLGRGDMLGLESLY